MYGGELAIVGVGVGVDVDVDIWFGDIAELGDSVILSRVCQDSPVTTSWRRTASLQVADRCVTLWRRPSKLGSEEEKENPAL